MTQQWFNALPLKRKISLMALLGFIILMTSFLSWWVFTPTYAVLFSHLDEADANQILRQLETEKINFQINKDGKEILIEKQLINQTRLKIMGSGMQLTGSVGFELFDKNDFGMTDFSQKINFQRALQGELERTISSLDEISLARVHLVLPENHLFHHEDNQPKAAVTLHLKKKITHNQVQSIQQLITASVSHLKLKDVVIVDQYGNTLSRTEEHHSNQQFTTKKVIEHYLTDKVMQMLQKIYPSDQVMVKIDAALNYDELQRELIKPQSEGLVTHEKEIKHSLTGKTDKDKKNQDITREKTYQFGSEKELFKRANGTIERLSISVILPQNSDAQTIQKVKNIVKNIIGFNEVRGDKISVEALISNPPSLEEPASIPEKTLYSATKTHYYFNIILVLLLLFTALATVYTKRSRHKRRQLLLIELNQWLIDHE